MLGRLHGDQPAVGEALLVAESVGLFESGLEEDSRVVGKRSLGCARDRPGADLREHRGLLRLVTQLQLGHQVHGIQLLEHAALYAMLG